MTQARSVLSRGGLLGLLLLGAAAAGLTRLNVEIQQFVPDASPLPAGPVGPAELGASAPQLSGPLDARPLSAFPETLARPLFVKSRRPPVAIAEETPVADDNSEETGARVSDTERIAPATQGLRLVGTLTSGTGTRRALLRLAEGAIPQWLGVGDEAEGWRVTSVGADRATLERDGTRVELRLYGNQSAERSSPIRAR